MSFFSWDQQALILSCHLQAKASKDEIVGLQGDALKIRITAPPLEGRANAHLCRFLAKAFGVKQQAVLIEQGELSRHKRIRIQAPARIPALLDAMMHA
ncbi:DUF167 family protein [Balneatrix alpica]|uniref:UPF0235 protein ACFFLH_06975 n=1 Tax=Balneatrix alpica TaxID=75684 RepID=A0ABV5ZA47_9GAMM|nr:DUF167 family protein [Balneatrix alpica]